MASQTHHHHLVLAWISALALCACSAMAGHHSRHVRLSSAPATQLKPTSSKPSATDQFLKAHNEERAAVGVAPLRWSAKLSGDAIRYVRYQRDHKGCDFADLGASPYGANQEWTSYPASPAEVVMSWVEDGRQYYDHANNTCAAGHECGTYTQVVWRKTVELGCAQATCAKGDATLTICLYYPHGNVQGQRPY